MVRPQEYFAADGSKRTDFDDSVRLGESAFVYYDNRRDWRQHPPPDEWMVCEDRSGRGHYLARVPATTATNAEEAREVVLGAPQGIRFFEYAPPDAVDNTVAQLAWLAWHTVGIELVRTFEGDGPPSRLTEFLQSRGLANEEEFLRLGAVTRLDSGALRAICPLCRCEIEASGLMSRIEQMEGREVVDLTVTEINLFHLQELRPGEYNHRPYNLAWGHHHCNAVARDIGVTATVEWMVEVLRRHGYTVNREE